MSTPEPPPEKARRRRNRRAVRGGIEHATTDETAWEDDERAWGEVPDDRDAELRRDVPPHWN